MFTDKPLASNLLTSAVAELCMGSLFLLQINLLNCVAFRLVPQLSSVGQLLISEAAFRKLATSLCSFPSILDVIHAFGKKVGDEKHTGISIADRTEGQRHGT